MIKRQCKLCNSEDVEIVLSPHNKNQAERQGINFIPTASDFGVFYKLARCKRCNILFSLLDDNKIDIKQWYHEAEDNLYLSQAQERSSNFKRILLHIKGFVSENSRLLDIGCSYGFFLDLAKDNGLEVYGVDISKDASNYCKDTLGLNVFCGDVEKADFPENYFDVITAIEIIEHVENPKAFLSCIHKILKPDGILYLVTPNIESLSARLFGYRWWSYRRMHLYYFSKKAVYEFLGRNGFSILGSSPYKKTFGIDYIVHQLYSSGYNKIFYYFLLGISNILKAKKLKITTSYGDIAVTAKKV